MEQVSGYKDTVYVSVFGFLYDPGKGIFDCLGPFPAPGFVTVWVHAPMYICCVDKFHGKTSVVKDGKGGTAPL